MRIVISREDVLLDTGGGLKKAAWFFLENPETSNEPFLLHNVDVLSTIDLRRMAEFHAQRKCSRDAGGAESQDFTLSAVRFVHEHSAAAEAVRMASRNWFVRHRTLRRSPSPESTSSPRGFCPMLSEDGAFSIITSYLRLAAQGESIQAFAADDYYWRDMGKPENIAQAEEDIKNGIVG